MNYCQADFSNMPFTLWLIPDGKRVAISPETALFVPFWDMGEPSAYFGQTCFGIEKDLFAYGKAYSLDNWPNLKAWLKRQSIQVVGYGVTQ